MRNKLAIAVKALGVFIATLQQYVWVSNGYYTDATFGQVVCAIAWTLVIIGFTNFASKAIKEDLAIMP